MMTGSQFQKYWRRQMDLFRAMRRDGAVWGQVLREWRLALGFHGAVGLLAAIAARLAAGRVVMPGLSFSESVGWWTALSVVVLCAGVSSVWRMVRSDARQRRYAWYRGIWPLAMRLYDMAALAVGIAAGLLLAGRISATWAS